MIDGGIHVYHVQGSVNEKRETCNNFSVERHQPQDIYKQDGIQESIYKIQKYS